MDSGPDSTNPVLFSPEDRETIYLLTSLTAASSSIITATSRLEHLLKSNKVPFKAVDLATDDKAKSLWGRRGGGKRLPGIVKDGLVLGDYEDVEAWNEYGELKQNLGIKSKKKKKKSPEDSASSSKRVTDLSGTTSSPIPMTSATPNIVPEEVADVVGGMQAAAIAAAAAAAGRNLKKTGSIKSVASKKEEGERPVTPIAVTGAKDVEEVIIEATTAKVIEVVPEKVMEQKVEEKVEENTEEKVEEKAEEDVGEKAGEKVEEKIEGQREEKVEDNVEEKAEENINEVVEEKEEPKPESPVIAAITPEDVKEPEEGAEDSMEIGVFPTATTTVLERIEGEEERIQEGIQEEHATVNINAETPATAAKDTAEEGSVIATAVVIEKVEQGEIEEVQVVEKEGEEEGEEGKGEEEKEEEKRGEVVEENKEEVKPEDPIATVAAPEMVEEKIGAGNDGDMLTTAPGVTTAATPDNTEEGEVKQVEEEVEEKKDEKDMEKVEVGKVEIEETDVVEPGVEKVAEDKKEGKVEEKEAKISKVEEKVEETKEGMKVRETVVAKEKVGRGIEKIEREKARLPVVQVEKTEQEKQVEAEKERQVKFEEAQKKLEAKSRAIDEKASNDKGTKDGEVDGYSNAGAGGKIYKNRLFARLFMRFSFKKSTSNLRDSNERGRRANLRKSRSTDELRRSTYALFRSKSTDKALQSGETSAAPPVPAIPAIPTSATPAS